MLIKNSAGDTVLVLDTKWKIINEKEEKFGISQADLYQMYAYGQSYLGGEGEMALIYPKTETFQTPADVFKHVDCGAKLLASSSCGPYLLT